LTIAARPSGANIDRGKTPVSSNSSRIARLNRASSPGRQQRRAFNLGMETAMNWDQIAIDWTQFKSKVSQNWVKLTDEDLTRISGRRKELASRLQERYGFGRQEAEREIEAWVKTQRHAA
jgi:uncharacterized protein YjbJ (UPF0337 family)